MSTDKVPVPYFETVGPDGKKIYKPKQWIERFRQYIKRTEKIDIIELINEQPVTITGWETNHEEKVKEEFLWALGPNALNEMTKSAYGENPTEMKIARLIQLYRENFTPKRNALYSRGDFFWAKQKAEETPEEHWKHLTEIEENCDFPITGIKPADLLISKFITSKTDERLRDKLIKEKSLTIPQLNEFLRQDTYDKRHGKNLIPKQITETHIKTEPIQKVSRTETRNRKCFYCNAPNWTTEHICPARKSHCNKCKKKAHFAVACKSKINYINRDNEKKRKKQRR